MVLRKALVFVGFLVGVFSTPVLAQQAGTTVIEPRLFYGATVNVENGVRVFRPLPRTRHVIINPNGAPVSLGFSEKRVYERRTHNSRHHHSHDYNDDRRGVITHSNVGTGRY